MIWRNAYIEIMRIPNSLLMGIAVLVGIQISDPNFFISQIAPLKAGLGFLTGFFLTASSMVLNDYVDRDIDAINEPTRPIPSGRILPRKALYYGLLLGFFGLVFSFFTGTYTFLLASLTFIVAVLYNFKLKKYGLLGNMCVAYTVSVPLLYGSLISSSFNWKISIYSAMIFLSIVGREIVKGISDVEGDSKRGIMTLAVRYGERFASIVAFLFFMSAVVLSIFPSIERMVNNFYIFFVSITDAMLIYFSIELIKSPNKKNAKKVKNRVLIAMFIGLIAFAVGSL
ncbi:MAG: UbiA family prenyltransferase [Fervidicoccaceae archaeon]